MRLVVRELCCVRGGRGVFNSLSFTVAAGEALCVTGPNGAGKSSLLRQIAGLLPIAGGTITLEGGDAQLSIGEQAHYLGHLDAVKPSLRVRENLAFWAAYFGGRRVEEALAALDLAPLAELPAGYLSAGQRRRLALARLIAADRPIWLLDEPTTALDTAAQGRLAALIATHRARGGLVIAAVHGSIGLADATELSLGAA